MRIVLRLVFIVALAGLGFWLWTIFFPSPESAVRKRMSSLAAIATFGANESNLARAAKAGSLVGCFSADALINIDVLGQGSHTFSGSDEIREAAFAGFGGLPGLKVEFLDMTVHIGADKQTADVDCATRVVIGNSKEGGLQEMHFQFKKVEREWFIVRAETVKTLS